MNCVSGNYPLPRFKRGQVFFIQGALVVITTAPEHFDMPEDYNYRIKVVGTPEVFHWHETELISNLTYSN